MVFWDDLSSCDNNGEEALKGERKTTYPVIQKDRIKIKKASLRNFLHQSGTVYMGKAEKRPVQKLNKSYILDVKACLNQAKQRKDT